MIEYNFVVPTFSGGKTIAHRLAHNHHERTMEQIVEITQDYLKKHLSYDPATGLFTRLHVYQRPDLIGTIAGFKVTGSSGKSYIRFSFKNRLYFAHRMAFLYMTGELPTEDVDHINGNGTDNKWNNLRAVSRSENGQNQRLQSRNKSGVTGVSYCNSRKRWLAGVHFNGNGIHLGRFKTIEEAIKAREDANFRLGFHVNHGSSRDL